MAVSLVMGWARMVSAASHALGASTVRNHGVSLRCRTRNLMAASILDSVDAGVVVHRPVGLAGGDDVGLLGLVQGAPVLDPCPELDAVGLLLLEGEGHGQDEGVRRALAHVPLGALGVDAVRHAWIS